MTTICYRDGIIAADSMISYNNITNGNRDKIAKCGKFLVALAGTSWLRRPLEAWAAMGCPEDEVPSSLLENEAKFAALFIDQQGQAYEFENGFLSPIHADYTAIGSGALLAIGAMAHGAEAQEAVVAASQHDKNTGGPVTAIHFSELNS